MQKKYETGSSAVSWALLKISTLQNSIWKNFSLQSEHFRKCQYVKTSSYTEICLTVSLSLQQMLSAIKFIGVRETDTSHFFLCALLFSASNLALLRQCDLAECTGLGYRRPGFYSQFSLWPLASLTRHFIPQGYNFPSANEDKSINFLCKVFQGPWIRRGR